MKHFNGLTVFAAGILAALSLALLGGFQPAAGEEVTSVGDHPEGCVSCHEGDVVETIGAKLDELGHPDVADWTETVPDDCTECHSEGGDYLTLAELSHIAHYRDHAGNAFLTNFGGKCLHCHSLDTETGAVGNKSGAKNW